eukprot:g5868.t1
MAVVTGTSGRQRAGGARLLAAAVGLRKRVREAVRPDAPKRVRAAAAAAAAAARDDEQREDTSRKAIDTRVLGAIEERLARGRRLARMRRAAAHAAAAALAAAGMAKEAARRAAHFAEQVEARAAAEEARIAGEIAAAEGAGPKAQAVAQVRAAAAAAGSSASAGAPQAARCAAPVTKLSILHFFAPKPVAKGAQPQQQRRQQNVLLEDKALDGASAGALGGNAGQAQAAASSV